VRIEVHDDGRGPGSGSFHRPGGVGLSVVRSLVLPAGGWLVLGRSPQGGACAAVTLPLLAVGAAS
jgi:signal transduction histidine kinase